MNFNWILYIDINLIAVALLALLGTILNSILVVIFVRRKRTRRKIPNILLLNQAITDLLNTSVFLIIQVFKLHYLKKVNNLKL